MRKDYTVTGADLSGFAATCRFANGALSCEMEKEGVGGLVVRDLL